jgi:hypothetical protein
VGALVVLSLGMALTMAPATESIMGSLPRAKAGVGSAINDTTRQVGGALGVAVLGSVLASAYASNLTDSLAGTQLPAEQVDAASQQLGAALQIAERVGGGAGEAIAAAARSAFVDGMTPALLIAAGVAALGALAVFAFLPARAPEPAREAGEARAEDAADAATRGVLPEPVDA